MDLVKLRTEVIIITYHIHDEPMTCPDGLPAQRNMIESSYGGPQSVPMLLFTSDRSKVEIPG